MSKIILLTFLLGLGNFTVLAKDNIVISNVKIVNGDKIINAKINTLNRGFDNYFHLKGICSYLDIKFLYYPKDKKVFLSKDNKYINIYLEKDLKLPQQPLFLQKKFFVSRDSLVYILKTILDTEVLYDKREKAIMIKKKIIISKEVKSNVSKKEIKQEKILIKGEKFEVRKIIIDAGHGGKDSGAVGKTGLFEKDCSLDIALELSKLIKKELKIDVILTREKDVYLSLPERCSLANKGKGDIFISIHMNANVSRKINGTEVYIYGNEATDKVSKSIATRENMEMASTKLVYSILNDIEKKSDENLSILLAGCIEDSLVESLNTVGRNNKKIMRAPFYVLANTAMPSVLIEVAFITNLEEEKKLKDKKFRSDTANAIFSGINNFIEISGVQNFAESSNISQEK
ncbi:MAG: N-acetylmuramoyl-L-alanine amidase [Candidatus Firestonebacteria bacterium]